MIVGYIANKAMNMPTSPRAGGIGNLAREGGPGAKWR
jgi:hypothetical protein